MNKDQIKSTYSMKKIIARYGLHPNRSGMMCCPFHKEKTASMKVYPDSYHCFACGADGDIFDFIMKMDGVPFKEVFLSLGGTYEKPTFESKLAIYRHKKKQEQRVFDAAKAKRKNHLNTMLISIYQRAVEQSEPLSQIWCDSMKALEYQLYLYDYNKNLQEKRGG